MKKIIAIGLIVLLFGCSSIATSFWGFTKRGKTLCTITLYAYNGSIIKQWDSKRISSDTDGNGIEFFEYKTGRYIYISGIFTVIEKESQ